MTAWREPWNQKEPWDPLELRINYMNDTATLVFNYSDGEPFLFHSRGRDRVMPPTQPRILSHLPPESKLFYVVFDLVLVLIKLTLLGIV